jgi:hypothetical protein
MKVMGQIMMCTLYISNYYLCKLFIKIIDNKKIEKNDELNDDRYIIHVKRYAISTCSGLEM